MDINKMIEDEQQIILLISMGKTNEQIRKEYPHISEQYINSLRQFNNKLTDKKIREVAKLFKNK
ncbi:MAG: hypothetical protein ATN35_11525 [Epulopiscium sp. Nele67-Bin004]|nr:MAG: hypothetical protein ATN35_11525 [Epulopiscium sp. Nele67-Bin004]